MVMDISARAISLGDRLQPSHLGQIRPALRGSGKTAMAPIEFDSTRSTTLAGGQLRLETLCAALCHRADLQSKGLPSQRNGVIF